MFLTVLIRYFFLSIFSRRKAKNLINMKNNHIFYLSIYLSKYMLYFNLFLLFRPFNPTFFNPFMRSKRLSQCTFLQQ